MTDDGIHPSSRVAVDRYFLDESGHGETTTTTTAPIRASQGSHRENIATSQSRIKTGTELTSKRGHNGGQVSASRQTN